MNDSTAVTLKPELVEELMKCIRSPEDIFGPTGLFQRLKGALMERLLEAEMAEHLGYEKRRRGPQERQQPQRVLAQDRADRKRPGRDSRAA